MPPHIKRILLYFLMIMNIQSRKWQKQNTDLFAHHGKRLEALGK